jgi:hypothetical protein
MLSVHPTPPIMRLLGLSFTSLLLLTATGEGIDPHCTNPSPAEEEPCAQPIEDVVAVTPGSFYTAKTRCYNCPYLQYTGDGAERERKEFHGDNDLVPHPHYHLLQSTRLTTS